MSISGTGAGMGIGSAIASHLHFPKIKTPSPKSQWAGGWMSLVGTWVGAIALSLDFP